MARRIEDRATEGSEHFALKVPDYDGNAARTLSEVQFLQLFREEATALLGLPQHPNLARFVTFDLASRPKPILVMELVEGPSLERQIAAGALETGRVFAILDGVLAGLGQMHQAGIGHLDIKPSNVILRQGREPVLVDFGLSGRHIRPGCATLTYGAPEIWGAAPSDWKPAPQPADIYAFGCMAYELLTSHDLFDAASEMALIATHMAHDGWPGALRRLATDPALRDLADALSRALRRDPRQRISAAPLRAALQAIAPALANRPWPLMPRVA
jgi:serine/threonine protein kinase